MKMEPSHLFMRNGTVPFIHHLISTLSVIAVALVAFLSGCGGLIRSQHFTIQNMSGATEPEVQRFTSTLEQARADVAKFLGREPPRSIWVRLQDGRAIPSARGGMLNFYRSRNQVETSAAAHEIVHLTTGYTSSPFIEEGLAVYVAESLAPNARDLFPQFGQSVDAWVALYLKKGTFLPLAQVLDIASFDWNLDGSAGDTQAWQTYMEAGSFVRWIVESKGWNTFWKFHQTKRVSPAIGSSLAEVEREWIEHLGQKKINTRPCRQVLRQDLPRFRFWCSQVEP